MNHLEVEKVRYFQRQIDREIYIEAFNVSISPKGYRDDVSWFTWPDDELERLRELGYLLRI
jgi:hypothetical protein